MQPPSSPRRPSDSRWAAHGQRRGDAGAARRPRGSGGREAEPSDAGGVVAGQRTAALLRPCPAGRVRASPPIFYHLLSFSLRKLCRFPPHVYFDLVGPRRAAGHRDGEMQPKSRVTGAAQARGAVLRPGLGTSPAGPRLQTAAASVSARQPCRSGAGP